MMCSRPLTAKLRWCLFSSVLHLSDLLELHNNNWASGSKHPGPSESDVYSDVVQEARSNDLLHTARLLIRLDTPLHDNNTRGTKYAVYYASVVTHTVFENKKNGCAQSYVGLEILQSLPLLLYSLCVLVRIFSWDNHDNYMSESTDGSDNLHRLCQMAHHPCVTVKMAITSIALHSGQRERPPASPF